MPRILGRVRRAIETRPVRSLLVIVAIVVPMAVAACYAGVDMWRRSGLDQVLEQTRRELARKSHDTVERVEVEFFKVRMLSVLLSNDPRVAESLRSRDPARLRELDRYLRDFAGSLRLHRAFVMDGRGVCIASSDHADPGSLVGMDFRDWDSFGAAMRGQPGTEFEVGRASDAPGFHFFVPVRLDGEIVGAVAVKVELETFADHIRFSSAFVTDDQGVVVLAGVPEHLLQALPGAPALARTPGELFQRYRRETLDVLPIRSAKMSGVDTFSYDDQTFLSLRQAARLPHEGLIAHVFEEIGGLDSIRDGFLLRFSLAALGAGLSLTLLLAAGVYSIRDAFQRRELLKLNAELQTQAQHDALTGCCNRRKFDEALQSELKRAERGGQPVALALLDLDRFKLVNDGHGHGVGDRMLAHVANLLRRELRATDVLARIGGEEFAVILPETDEAQAEAIMDRLRKLVEAAPLLTEKAAVGQTVSAGVAAAMGGEDFQDLLREADVALYAAKRCGRNRVVRASTVDQVVGEADEDGHSRQDFA